MMKVLIPMHSAGRQSSWFRIIGAQEGEQPYRYFRSWLLVKNYSIWTHKKAASYLGLGYLCQHKAVEGPGETVHLAACFVKVSRSSILFTT